MKKHVNGFRQVAAAIVIPMLLWGCGTGKTSQPDPFFDTWRAEAEATQGYSPRAAAPEETEAGKDQQALSSPDMEPEAEFPPARPPTPTPRPCMTPPSSRS
jgi:hypothetical protein